MMERFVFDGGVERCRTRVKRDGEKTQVAMIALLSASRSLRRWFVAPLERRTQNAFLKSGGPKLIVGARREGRGQHKFQAILCAGEIFRCHVRNGRNPRFKMKSFTTDRARLLLIYHLCEASTLFLRISI